MKESLQVEHILKGKKKSHTKTFGLVARVVIRWSHFSFKHLMTCWYFPGYLWWVVEFFSVQENWTFSLLVNYKLSTKQWKWTSRVSLKVESTLELRIRMWTACFHPSDCVSVIHGYPSGNLWDVSSAKWKPLALTLGNQSRLLKSVSSRKQ